jgi:hypothetical protein
MKKAQDAFNKAAGAAGAGWQVCLQEAKRRKAIMEGRDPDAPAPEKKPRKKKAAAEGAEESSGAEDAAEAKPKKPRKKADASGLAAGGAAPAEKPVKKAPKAKKPVVDVRAQMLAEAGLIEKEVDGVLYLIETETGEAFLPGEGDEILGDRAGVYDADLEIVDTEA